MPFSRLDAINCAKVYFVLHIEKNNGQILSTN